MIDQVNVVVVLALLVVALVALETARDDYHRIAAGTTRTAKAGPTKESLNTVTRGKTGRFVRAG